MGGSPVAADSFMSAFMDAQGGSLVCGGSADGVRIPHDAAELHGVETCRLQVKGTGGQMACILELPASATLATVHARLQQQSIVGLATKYELRTAFPSRSLTDPNRSLGELGLVPSATLCVRLM